MPPLRTLILLAALSLIAAPALAQCSISGHITATGNVDMPELGAWMYTLEVTWDTGGPYALSHLNLRVGLLGEECTCSDFAAAIEFAGIAGESTGEPGDCTVQYEAFLECNGDPSIPVEGILFKWEPIEDDDSCEPGPMGTGWFVFYSDVEPVDLDSDHPLVIEKHDGAACEGQVTGVFPGLLCNTVSSEATSWSEVKGVYAR